MPAFEYDNSHLAISSSGDRYYNQLSAFRSFSRPQRAIITQRIKPLLRRMLRNTHVQVYMMCIYPTGNELAEGREFQQVQRAEGSLESRREPETGRHRSARSGFLHSFFCAAAAALFASADARLSRARESHVKCDCWVSMVGFFLIPVS